MPKSKQSAKKTIISRKYANMLCCAIIFVCICICAWVLICILPIYTISNRTVLINSYNSKINEWKTIKDNFSDTSFALSHFGRSTNLKSISDTEGELWPVHDTCNKNYDPPIGCLSEEEIFFSASINSTNTTIFFEIIVGNNLNTIKYSIDEYQRVELNDSQIGCLSSNVSCSEICSFYGGHYFENSTCIINGYIDSLCLKISNDIQGNYRLDTSHYTGVGCYPTETGSNLPFHVLPIKQDIINISIRHYLDPYISANYYTNYCSSIRTDDTNCFGEIVGSTQYTDQGRVIFPTATIFLVLFIILGMYVYSKDNPDLKSIPSPPSHRDSRGSSDIRTANIELGTVSNQQHTKTNTSHKNALNNREKQTYIDTLSPLSPVSPISP
ncbi:hypothetical protein WA158_006342 [Blastocystis sp. Blastoise]